MSAPGFLRQSPIYTYFWLVCAALLVGCSARPPAPTQPVQVEVQLPPELASTSLVRALELCAETQPHVELALEVISDSTLRTGAADMVIGAGDPPEETAFSAPLAVQELAVVVHPDNPLRTLKLEDLKAIFSGRLTSWDELGGPDEPIQTWSYFQGSQMEAVFQQVFLSGAQVSTQTLLAGEPEAVLAAVAIDRGAIGYLPAAWLDASVQRVSLEADVRTRLQQPLIASTAAMPEAHLRSFLYCLQSGPGHEYLMQSYLAWRGS